MGQAIANDKEVKKANYRVKSAFFYRNRASFIEALKLLESRNWNLSWPNPTEINISQKAIDTIRASGLPLERVFCHPMVIRAEPKLIVFYRSLACISQKGIRLYGIPVEEFERGKEIPMPKALELAKTINTFITDLIDNDPKFTIGDATIAAAMTFGSQIEGSWRNAVGAEAERRIKQIIIGYLREKNVIKSVTLKNKQILEATETFSIDELLGITLVNGYSLKFGSDPDVELFDNSETLLGVIEIKGGLDPAGALERYGAAKKSFSSARNRNKAAETIYIALLTDTVKDHIKHDQQVSREYEIAQVFTDGKIRVSFLERILWLLHGLN